MGRWLVRGARASTPRRDKPVTYSRRRTEQAFRRPGLVPGCTSTRPMAAGLPRRTMRPLAGTQHRRLPDTCRQDRRVPGIRRPDGPVRAGRREGRFASPGAPAGVGPQGVSGKPRPGPPLSEVVHGDAYQTLSVSLLSWIYACIRISSVAEHKRRSAQALLERTACTDDGCVTP